MRLLPIAIACAVFSVAGFAHAGPIKVLKSIDSCAIQTGAQQAACLTARLDAAQQSLVSTITAIKSHFPAGAPYGATFDFSYDTWVKDVSVTCHAYAMSQGADANGASDLRCRIDMTTAREQLLKKLYAI